MAHSHSGATACSSGAEAGLGVKASDGELLSSAAAPRISCAVCPHACSLAEGQDGICRARGVRDGRVVPLGFGAITSFALDPVEKKPLARFHPGAKVLSLGSYGCNLRCPFCQNADIAQAGRDRVRYRFMEPEEVVERARGLRDAGCIGIAYTYNEPVVSLEYVVECARLAHRAGLANVLVSNGMMTSDALGLVAPLIDAANIDLKGFTQRFYDWVGGDLSAVMRTIETVVRGGTCHVEVTTLVIPSRNDDDAEIEAAASWLASLDRGIPYHLTRFFPMHRLLDVPPTPVATLERLALVARRHLDDVLIGNV